MVGQELVVEGVDLRGRTAAGSAPVLLQLQSEDFPRRFQQDLLVQGGAAPPPAISSTAAVDPAQPLFQPVQRMLHLAMVQLSCERPGRPRLDPTRILSAGVVIRRCVRTNRIDDYGTLQGWMRAPDGRSQWTTLDALAARLDPDPAQRPQLFSGRAELDAQLAAIAMSSASAEATSSAFAAPPATCAALGRTVVYGVVPTASSETSDAAPRNAITYGASDVAANVPTLLQAGAGPRPLAAVLQGAAIDYRWMSDDFLNAQFPPAQTLPAAGQKDASGTTIADFQRFSIALRMLRTVFGAFDATDEGRAVLAVLNGFNVYTSADTSATGPTQPMGAYYAAAARDLIDYVPSGGGAAPVVVLPYAFDALGPAEPTALATALLGALAPQTKAMLMPQGRFQDATRVYRLRMFFRIASEHAGCPPELVWSDDSAPFRIAAWYENGNRPHPPIPLPDPTDRDFLKNLKPNCSFVVPPGLMSAMQNSTMSGLLKGAGGGGPSLTLGWLCGFNIPLITICAFFVLNIFLGLLNIVFFWLPMIKICIPFPEEE